MFNPSRLFTYQTILCSALMVCALSGCQPKGDQVPAGSASKSASTKPVVPIVLKDWGPQETKAGTGFNLQPGNVSAIWIGVSGVANHPETLVLWDGKALEGIVVAPELVTAAVPASFYKSAGTYKIQIKEGGTERIFDVGSFIVNVN